MKESSSTRDLQSLLDAIKASDVVENRVQLLTELKELIISETSELTSIIEALTTILSIAAKYLDLDISGCQGEFLGLGIKASAWCRKHLKMTLMSTEESPEEEHSDLFFEYFPNFLSHSKELLLNLLSYSAASFSAMARYPISSSKEFILTIKNFISEQLNLTKDALSEIKRIHGFGSEVQKVSQVVLDAVIRLCKVYCNGVNWDFDSLKMNEDKKVLVIEGASDADHVINITKCTIDKLCEVGILAANDGGSLVSVLNLSWKGVVTLLQLGKGALAATVDVASVVVSLISLAQQSLRCAAETWSLQLKETLTMTEAKRIFLPVKFYLINAVRIVSQYTTQAFSVYKEMVGCVVMISSLKFFLSKEEHLKSATEALVEILQPTSFHLLNSLLNSIQVKQEEKFQVLNWLFSDESNLNPVPRVSNGENLPYTVDGIHFSSCAAMAVQTFFLGRVNLFLELLKSSADLEDDVKFWMARKLQWLLDILVDEHVYAASLTLQVPVSRKNQEFIYQPFFHTIVNSLETFMVVMSSNPAWGEIESFLLENLLHPHILCWEIVTELWCFLLRHAETSLVRDIIDKLCALLGYTAFPEAVFSPGSALRKIARSICLIVTCCSQAVADQVYDAVTGDNKSQDSSMIYTALLMEGFPLTILSQRTRSTAKARVLTEYFCFVESFGSELPKTSGFEIYGAPVDALSATLLSQQVSISDPEMKTLKFLVAIIDKYRKCNDSKLKEIYCRLLTEVLTITSNMKHLYSCDEIEGVILELRNLFIPRPALSAEDSLLFQCKPNLANFMAGLGHVELAESDDNARTSAVWELYHMLLREQHWAFIHLALTAFGYFAARTPCVQLWRFVPQDAALSFDLESGNEADEDRFMAELKGFLDKESASILTKPTPDHTGMLLKEGLKLKEMLNKNLAINEEAAIGDDAMEVDEHNHGNKKRKFPDEIGKGVELLQSGLKVMGDGLSHWQHNQTGLNEIHDKILTHFSRLEDVVSHLVRLTGDA
ncbi:unnamed protein product [Coffea canephora]|uniref:Uncharacterized protein n=1 Tax=Coffea canephora TaxID=49390 RepID=A0A068TTU7_COFCA|nr:unnamed protein product [Coffea canephora]